MSSLIDFTKQGTIGESSRPKRYDIEIYQGDTFERVIRFQDSQGAVINLTGATVNVKFAKTPTGSNPPSQPTSTLNGASGEVTITIADTSGFEGEYHWDLQLTVGGKKKTYIGGVVTVVTDITPDVA